MKTLCIIVFLCRVSQPLFIGGLLSYFNPVGSNNTDLRYAYFNAFGLVLSMLLAFIFYHGTQIEIIHCGMQMRIACCSTIYNKVFNFAIIDTNIS